MARYSVVCSLYVSEELQRRLASIVALTNNSCPRELQAL